MPIVWASAVCGLADDRTTFFPPHWWGPGWSCNLIRCRKTLQLRFS